MAVAGLCADWKLDVQAIMAALMHDAMEDCGITKPELIERFGAPTAELVDGLTKLDKLHFSTREQGQAESFRKMLLAMARDVRVILIKLADRLHNMRTMQAMAPDKRQRIARETLDIYAPIAHRLGLNQSYRELQELSFEFLYPWRHGALAKAVQRARGHRRDIVERVRADVEKAFAKAKIKIKVSGREKTVYSIYRKMREKHAGFAQVSDVFGFRIVVTTQPECYLALGVLHQLYKPVPGRFKDFVAIPKANGYQSLHTTLVSPLGTAVEFQIRTDAMHAVAESGIAAHWLYKVNDKDANHAGDAQRLGAMWLQSLIDIQDDTRDSAEFLEHVKIDLFPDAVYVFTPRSKILALPRGATPVDFAYAIHSDVGDHTVAAKVNGEPVALRTELRSGDVVEIVTAPGAKPNPAWLNTVRTGRARSKIRHFLKTMEQDESRAHGREDAGPGAARRRPAPARQQPGRHRGRGAVAATDPLERQPQPRRPDGRHRAGPQDRRHRRQAPGADHDRPGHAPRRGDADAGALCRRRQRRGAGRGLHRRQRRRVGADGAMLPADPRRRRRRLPRPRRRPGGAHPRMPGRPAAVRARQRALDAGRMGRGADARLRDRRAGAGAQRQGCAGPGGRGHRRRRGRHHPPRHGPRTRRRIRPN